MRSPFFYVVLLVLVVLDGWLLAHPNLIGRAGVFFFEYTYLETFPKALATVATVVGLALLLIWAIGRLGQMLAIVGYAALLMSAAYWLFDSFVLYNSGIYKLTGAGFRAGAILLPGLLVLVMGKSLWETIQNRRTT